jgi:hypothetical protein
MFLHVTGAKQLDDYRVRVCFDDGREGIADLTEAFEGPMFESLKEPDVFRRLRVDKELQTVVWPNGTDLAPEYIYCQAFRDDSELQATFRKWGYIT